jgi:lysophospholipase L1-like esterase
MKRNLILVALFGLSVLAFAQGAYRPQMAILGDSYSTFAGYVEPGNNLAWYPREKQNDCVSVEQTWWHLLASRMGWRLTKNNSFSGSTICNTGYDKNDYSDRSYVTRMGNLGSPDIIFVFGGTNDSWANSPMGPFKYADWKKEDLYQFRPAMAYMLDFLQKRYINVKLYFILNNELSEELTQSCIDICKHYGVGCIELKDIEKQNGHPSKLGMQQIAHQVEMFMSKGCGSCK